MMRLNRKGFTLVEIMIVVAIIALLAAIAVPNLLRARHNANEGAASASVRTVATAAASFYSVQTPKAWPAGFVALATATPPYLPSKFNAASPAIQGYTFVYTMVAPVADPTNSYPLISATPVTYHTTGTRTFAYWSFAGEVRAQDLAASGNIITEAAYNAMTAMD